MSTVVGALRPTFRLAKLEGDAAYAYTLAATVDASLLQDVVERTYVAFRKRLQHTGRASRCECNACSKIPNLNLNLVVHHGLVAQQRMAGRDELVGRDVILIHRLLKNRIAEATGIVAYAAYSTRVAAMGAPKPRERAAFEQLMPGVEAMLASVIESLVELLGKEPAHRAPDPAEPVLSRSRQRFVTEPATAGAGNVDSARMRSSEG